MIFRQEVFTLTKIRWETYDQKKFWVIFHIFLNLLAAVGMLDYWAVNISMTEDWGGGVEAGQTAISASNAQARLSCHCNPHILTSLTLACCNHKELFQISHHMVLPWVGGWTQQRESDIVMWLHNFLTHKRFSLAVLKLKESPKSLHPKAIYTARQFMTLIKTPKTGIRWFFCEILSQYIIMQYLEHIC